MCGGSSLSNVDYYDARLKSSVTVTKGGYAWYVSDNSSSKLTNNRTGESTQSSARVILYSGTTLGYSPTPIKVQAGDTLTITGTDSYTNVFVTR